MTFRCDNCGKEFDSKKEAEKHEKNCLNKKKELKHGKNSYLLLDEKGSLIKRIRDERFAFWLGLFILLFFWWTGLGLIIGLAFMIYSSSKKKKLEKRLLEVDYELR